MNRSRLVSLFTLSLLSLAALPQLAQAQAILRAQSASTNMSSFFGSPNSLINGSNLSAAYTSGVTNFDTFVGSTTHNFFQGGNFNGDWVSGFGTTLGNVDFNMGSVVTLDRIAVWNWGGSDPLSLRAFKLWTANNSAFTGKTLLGTFSTSNYTANASVNPADVFSFAQTTNQYFRMEITQNNGSSQFTGLGEVAFRQGPPPSLTPEMPGSVQLAAALLPLGLVGLRKRFQKK